MRPSPLSGLLRLEDRIALAADTYRWDPPELTNLDWAMSGNWDILNIGTGAY